MSVRLSGNLLVKVVSSLLVALAFAAPARAQPTDAQLSAAREMFTSAEKDEDAKRWSDALEKLRRVSDVKLTSGVRYHTALCEEHLGHLAAALSDYTAAESQARADDAQDVLRLVGRRVLDLAARVPRLVVRIAPELADATVKLDGEPISRALLGTAMPVDPGVHSIEAASPGRSPSAEVLTLREGDSMAVDMKPELPQASSSATTPARIPEPTATRGDRRVAIFATVGAIGLTATGLAAYLAAGGAHDDAVRACPGVTNCDSQRMTVRAWDSLAAGAWVGGAIVGTIAVLSWTKSAAPRPVSASARLLVGPALLTFRGTF